MELSMREKNIHLKKRFKKLKNEISNFDGVTNKSL